MLRYPKLFFIHLTKLCVGTCPLESYLATPFLKLYNSLNDKLIFRYMPNRAVGSYAPDLTGVAKLTVIGYH